MPGQPGMSPVSIGVYIFDAAYLNRLVDEDAVNEDSSHDLDRDIVPRPLAEMRAVAHPFHLSSVSGSEQKDEPPY
jgi:glucose-1-phosphate adenylyltransferase